MKISTLQAEVHAALEASDWVKIGAGTVEAPLAFAVLDEGSSEGTTADNPFLAAKEKALAEQGFVLVVTALAGMPTTTTQRGGRACGPSAIGIVLIARTEAQFAAMGGRIEDTFRAVARLAGENLQSFDYARLSEVGGDRAYVVSFDIFTSVSA